MVVTLFFCVVPSWESYDYSCEYDDGPSVGKVRLLPLCFPSDGERVRHQKIWTGGVAIVGVLKPEEVILHSRQGWSTISIGVIPVDFE